MFQEASPELLKRGTLFASRAARLHDAYVRHEALESVPDALRARLEADVLRASFADAWEATARFWRPRAR